MRLTCLCLFSWDQAASARRRSADELEFTPQWNPQARPVNVRFARLVSGRRSPILVTGAKVWAIRVACGRAR